MTTFPVAGDYYKAVQAPGRAFTVPKLQTAQFVWDSLGPTLARGSSAVVFQAAVDGSPQALRCYIRNDASSRDRYSALSAYLASHDLGPHVSGTIWMDAAIRVNSATWPVLQMGWIDGRTLNEYVDFLVAGSNVAALTTLAARWRDMVALLQNSSFGHGDLQHGNVLVDQEGQLRLVDFDGVWIPQLAGQSPPTEYGHPNYQRPGLREWERWLDTFSALVIYLSLVALSKDPALWLALYSSKNLLFSRTDFFAPYETEVWKQLAALRDPQVDELTRRLKECCAADWVAAASLETTLDQRASAPAPAPWWKQQSVTPAAPPAGPTFTPTPSPSPNPSPGPTFTPSSSPAGSPAGGPWPWNAEAQQSQEAQNSLPRPPPLSAPLGQAGTGPVTPLRQTMAPPGATWWYGKESGSAQPLRPQQPPQPSQQPQPQQPKQPPAPRPRGPVSKRQQAQTFGGIALGVGVVMLIAGAAASQFAVVIIGLIVAAWGIWRLVTAGGGQNTTPPGQT
jgi:eukaryotic-like serine/threonine-protein kinase